VGPSGLPAAGSYRNCDNCRSPEKRSAGLADAEPRLGARRSLVTPGSRPSATATRTHPTPGGRTPRPASTPERLALDCLTGDQERCGPPSQIGSRIQVAVVVAPHDVGERLQHHFARCARDRDGRLHRILVPRTRRGGRCSGHRSACVCLERREKPGRSDAMNHRITSSLRFWPDSPQETRKRVARWQEAPCQAAAIARGDS
jgi:hypothetical protein